MFAVGLKKEKPNSSMEGGQNANRHKIYKKYGGGFKNFGGALSHRPLKRAHMYLHFKGPHIFIKGNDLVGE